MKKYIVGVWGQFGDGGQIADGQAVRTTIITDELIGRYGKDSVMKVNTNGWKKHPLSFLLETIGIVRKCKFIVIAPADNGFKVMVPLLNFINCIFLSKIIYVVIGGFLPKLLEAKPKYVKMLKKYRAIFAQTTNLKKDLEGLGLANLYILSNLKRLNTLNSNEISVIKDERVKVCTLSRITEDKGIRYAVDAVRIANEELGRSLIELDIFGIVADNYKESFERLIESNKDIVTYKGVIDYDKTVESLESYFAMLFPTYYYGEGLPGTVVDAYNSGLPIIATRWMYNPDVIKDGVNGYLVPIKDAEEMAKALLILYRDRKTHYNMRINNLIEAEKYRPEVVLKDFFAIIDAG